MRVMNASQLYIGQEGRFGGKVVKVTNGTGRTRLEIATVPLDDGAVPLMHRPSVGRIIAQINGFVEPSDLKGQWITVVGPITGTEKGHIDKADYTYMVLQVNGYKRWRVVRQVSAPMGPPFGPWGWDYRYGSPWGPNTAQPRGVLRRHAGRHRAVGLTPRRCPGSLTPGAREACGNDGRNRFLTRPVENVPDAWRFTRHRAGLFRRPSFFPYHVIRESSVRLSIDYHGSSITRQMSASPSASLGGGRYRICAHLHLLSPIGTDSDV